MPHRQTAILRLGEQAALRILVSDLFRGCLKECFGKASLDNAQGY